jgi:hypothetical protein
VYDFNQADVGGAYNLFFPGLVQVTNSLFYGSTFFGGTNGDGTAYALSVGLGPYVKTLPTSDSVFSEVKILGSNLNGVNSDGVTAAFTFELKTLISATVPRRRS